MNLLHFFLLFFTFANSLQAMEQNNSLSSGAVHSSLYRAVVDVYDAFRYDTSSSTYASWIQTKISNKGGYRVNALFLGSSGPILPQPYIGGGSLQAAELTVLLKLADFSDPGTTCQNALPVDLYTSPGGNTPVVATIRHGSTTATTNAFTMAFTPRGTTPLAKKDVRFLYRAIDFNRLFNDSGIECAQKKSHIRKKGVPSCLIGEENDSVVTSKYKAVFGEAAFSRCYLNNARPCAASTEFQDADPPYNNQYGCFECSIADVSYSCSYDSFAIRPNRFSFDAAHKDFPHLLRSAKDYNLSIYAYDYGTTEDANTSGGYNVADAASLLRLLATKYDQNDNIAVSMHGTLLWSNNFYISGGRSQSHIQAGSEVAQIHFNDVGKINLQVVDTNWAAVDRDNPNDTTPHNCSQEGAFICGDMNITYIPHHFDFSDLAITNNNQTEGAFTYIANEVDSMAARITTKIKALNADGEVTKNFAPSPLWENSVSIVPTVKASRYIYPRANETNITKRTIRFNAGEKIIPSDEKNTSQYLRFNFRRDTHRASNPFIVQGKDINITISSYYRDPLDGDTVEIQGSREGNIRPADGNATFLYGRTHTSRQRYSGNRGSANIYFESYCFGATCDKTLLPNSLTSKKVDDVRWFINEKHNTLSDGALGNVTVKNDSFLTISNNPLKNPSVITITYDASLGYPYKTTIRHEASPWLIYDINNPDASEHGVQIEFENEGTWTGKHKTKTTTKSVGSVISNRRIMW